MASFNLYAAATMSRIRSVPSDFKSALCHTPAENFESNAARVLGMAMLPSYCAMLADRWAKCVDRALTEEDDGRSPSARATQYMNEAMAGEPAHFRKDFRKTTADIEKFLAVSGDEIEKSATAFLQSVILQAWIAFEALLVDIWSSLATVYAKRLTKAADRYSFKALASAERAFGEMFGKGSAPFAILGCAEVQRLAQVRHILIHRSGKVDRLFREGCENAKINEWETLPDGHEFVIDGVFVASLVEPLFVQGYQLLADIDLWTQTTPP